MTSDCKQAWQLFALKSLKLMFIFTISILSTQGQVNGDFQTKNATGNWSDFNSWNIRTGGFWVPAIAGQIPAITSSVFIQMNNAITVDVITAVCNDINYMAPNTTPKINFATNTVLSIYGSILQFNSTNIPFPPAGWAPGAKLVFAGSANQTIANSSAITQLDNVEINKTGGVFTLPGVTTKFTVFTLTAGNITGAAGSTLQGTSSSATVNINGGNFTQTAIGPNRINGGAGGADCILNVNGGTMALFTTSGTGLGFNFSAVSILNGGTINLNNDISAINITASFAVDATSVLNTSMKTTPSAITNSFLGTVNYNFSGTQNIINTFYGNLGLSGSGNKDLSADLNVTGNVDISGNAVLPLGIRTANVGGNWTSYGTAGLTESSSTVNFNGNSSQSINTTGGEDFFLMKKSGSGMLTLNSDVATGGGAGSGLDISSGILNAGIHTLSGTATSTLTMTDGTLRLAKLTTQPEFTGTCNLSGGTIEFSATGIQILRGGIAYRNLTFSNVTTTTLSSNPSGITGTVYITGSATLDVSNNTFGSINTNLTMDGGRFRMSGTTTKPDIDGTYTLSGGVIEFYNSLITRQNIKGQNATSVPVLYNQVEVTGTSVGNSGSNITLNAGGIFTIKSAAIFEMSDNSIVGPAGSQMLRVENGATFKCAVAPGFIGPAAFPNSPAVRNDIETVILQPGSTIDYSRATPAQINGNQIITNTLPYQNFTISGNGIKTAPPATLTIQGNLNKTGTATFAHNTGTLLVNGTAAQTYSSVNPIMAFYNFTNSNTTAFTVNDSLAVLKELLLPDGAKLNLGTGDVILKSSDTLTANIATIGTAVISYAAGRFVVERFINTGTGHARTWQFLSVPTSGQTINAAWQEGGVAGSNPKPGYGTQLTNPLGTGAGYDLASLATSVKTYISSVDKWDTGPANTGNAIANPKGYMLFVRGDRTVASGSGSSPTILRTRGTIFTGTQPTMAVSANQLESIGNPYASAIDLRKLRLTSSNLTNEVYVWDPTLGGSYGFGRYRSLTWDGSHYLVIPSGGTYPGPFVDTLQSGQAFFVKADNTTGSVQFTEAAKVSGGSRLVNLRFPGIFPGKKSLLSANLSSVKSIGSKELQDGAIVIFSPAYSEKVDTQDGTKLVNAGENAGFIREGRLLVIERRPVPKVQDTLHLYLSGTKVQAYNWTFNLENMHAPGRKVYLWDRFTNTKTELNLTGSTSVYFAVDNRPASATADRFKIVFSIERPRPQVPAKPPASISVYPNPVASRKMNLQFCSQAAGNYVLQLNNKLGQAVFRGAVSVSGSNLSKIIILPSDIITGSYQLSITSANGSRTVLQLMVE